MGGYVVLALGLFYLSVLLAQWSGYGLIPKLAVNTVLMLGFLGVVWKLEGENLKKI
jgi:hypothetical protein